MNDIKVKRVKKGTIKPIAPFKTLKEEAEYWDTHSPLEENNQGEAGFYRATKTGTLTIRFDEHDVAQLRKMAEKKGMGTGTLVRTWIKEILQGNSQL